MTYKQKTYKKCNFVKLSKDPLKPPSKKEQEIKVYPYKGTTLKEWRDGWFKGQYELNESE